MKNQSYVFVANHQGAFDIFLIYGFLGRNFKWVFVPSRVIGIFTDTTISLSSWLRHHTSYAFGIAIGLVVAVIGLFLSQSACRSVSRCPYSLALTLVIRCVG